MKIKFVNGPKAGQTAEFALPEITIGREDGNILRIPGEGVSRTHALLRNTGSGVWKICDQNSTNGVKVNGSRISGEKVLSDGDLLEIGSQSLMVEDLSAEVSPVIFNPIITSSFPAPGHKEAPGPEVAPGTAVDPSQTLHISAPDIEYSQRILKQVKSSSGRLFGQHGDKSGDRKAAAKESPEPAPAAPKRPRFANMRFAVTLAALAVLVIAVITLAGRGNRKETPVQHGEQPLLVSFEKVCAQPDNIFRFSMTLENKRATFMIDDVKSRRHSEPLVLDNAPGIEELRGIIRDSGIWSLSGRSDGPAAEELRRRLVVIEGSRQVDLTLCGSRTPAEFERVENAIYNFAEGCGMQTISMTSEELQRQAADSFFKAEDLFANRESRPANLRDAIIRYRVVENTLAQFSPPLNMWKQARARLKEAQQLREAKLKELDFERVRLQNIRDFGQLRNVFLQIMELTDADSPEYETARERLYKLDRYLKKGGGK